MDNIYQIISRAINIDKERELYTDIYNTVRDLFIKALKQNEIFKTLFCDLSLTGSYPDNLKISKPDEFDLLMRLKFPDDHLVKIRPDNSNLGSVYIDLSDLLKHLDQSSKISIFLRGKVNENGYFLLDKFQSWLEGRFENFLTSIRRELVYNGITYRLSHSKNGPAHTIGVATGHFELLSIDFVPGFRFENSKSISPRRPTMRYWDAIPRPQHGTNNNPSFKCSYADSERSIILDKYNLKQAARLMKKFRDMKEMWSLKSYYIKTLFLWMDEEHGSHFWREQSITTVLHAMFEKLETALRNQRINWFWNKNVNLLQYLTPGQIESMYYEVKNTRKILLHPKSPDDILNIFLTKEEQYGTTPKDKENIKESFASIPTPVAAGIGALVAGAGLYLLYQLFKPNEKRRT